MAAAASTYTSTSQFALAPLVAGPAPDRAAFTGRADGDGGPSPGDGGDGGGGGACAARWMCCRSIRLGRRGSRHAMAVVRGIQQPATAADDSCH